MDQFSANLIGFNRRGHSGLANVIGSYRMMAAWAATGLVLCSLAMPAMGPLAAAAVFATKLAGGAWALENFVALIGWGAAVLGGTSDPMPKFWQRLLPWAPPPQFALRP